MVKRIVFIVNVDWFFISHRLSLATHAIEKQWDVYLITKDTGRFDELSALGINCIPLEITRAGKNPLKEIKLILQLRRILRNIEPDIIHNITLKPSLYGTLAARGLKGKIRVINAVSGLGYTFTDNRRSLGKGVLLKFMRIAFADKRSNFIFQNPDDRNLYKDLGFLNDFNYIIIKGSGVDENKFPYHAPKVSDKLRVTLPARMLKDKGVVEFIMAGEKLRKKHSNKVEFILVGGIDLDNPAHLTISQLNDLCDGDYIKWIGHQTDVKSVYINSDIVCLPSYREGLPKSLIEAMAIGRPIVTTDAIGCRECVDEGINGFKVPVKNIDILADKLEKLIDDETLRVKMGEQSRLKMIQEMSLSKVIDLTFTFYGD